MKTRYTICVGLCVSVSGCAPKPPTDPYVPALRYSTKQASQRPIHGLEWKAGAVEEVSQEGKAQLRLVSKEAQRAPVIQSSQDSGAGLPLTQTQFMEPGEDLGEGVKVLRSTEMLPPAYTGPLELGNPGVGASLWHEGRAGNEVYRDFRAWEPMDLLTIVVNEVSIGRHFGLTEVKGKSEYQAAIENFFGLEEQTQQWKYPPDLSSLIKAATKNDFKGEGQTNRQAQLTARISGVVVEVLPSGLLRVEGEKIMSVNNEEQVMVISGLVRTRDISSDNEVQSSKIAQMRVDFYGKGTVGEAQYGGWFGRLLRILWPF